MREILVTRRVSGRWL